MANKIPKTRPTHRQACVLFLLRNQLCLTQKQMAEEISKHHDSDALVQCGSISCYENHEPVNNPVYRAITEYIDSWKLVFKKSTDEAVQAHVTLTEEQTKEALDAVERLRKVFLQ